MARTTAAERWSVLVDEHEASGLSIRAFAAQAEVNPRTLAWWRSRLGLAFRTGRHTASLTSTFSR